MYVPGVAGAVYKPVLDTIPPVADQVTPEDEPPVTVAENCCAEPGWRLAVDGVTWTETEDT